MAVVLVNFLGVSVYLINIPRSQGRTAYSFELCIQANSEKFIRNKEENVPVISAETKVTPQVNSRGAEVFSNQLSSRTDHRISEESDPRNIVADGEDNRDHQMHPSRHETTHRQNHNLGPSLHRYTHLLSDLEDLRQSPSQFRNLHILAA